MARNQETSLCKLTTSPPSPLQHFGEGWVDVSARGEVITSQKYKIASKSDHKRSDFLFFQISGV